MEIIKGSSIVETLDSLVSTKKIFGVSDNKPLLVVEGSDDIEVIHKYYYYSSKTPPLKVVLAGNIEQEGDSKKNGKRNVFKSYQKHKRHFEKIFCLVDRDFDFLLGEEEVDPNIFYYDFYELENYLFDESVLKLFFVRYFNCGTDEKFEKLIKELDEAKEVFFPYSMVGVFRELHYRNRTEVTLDQQNILHLSSAVNKKPESVFNFNSQEYKQLTVKEKVVKYFEEELAKINLSLDEILKNTIEESAATFEITSEDEALSYFKYFISGKFILGSLQSIMKEFTTLPFLSSGSTTSLEITLKNEWIPGNSVDFKNLIHSIEDQL